MTRENATVSSSKTVLDNGIRLIVQENHSMPTISTAVFFIGGRRVETSAGAGLSALARNLMTKGAGELDARALADQLEYYGIVAYPVRGYDTAGIRMKTLSRHFDRALGLVSSIILEPSFGEGEFEKEKGNLLEEIVRQKDNTLSYCLDMCHQLVFEDHPYGFPALGTEESVASLKSSDVRDYYMHVFSPDRMVISVAGDIKAEEAKEKVEKYFSSMVSRPFSEDPGPVKNPIKNVRERQESSEKQQVAISIGFQGPDVLDEDFCSFRVLNQVLSGMGSRLFIELRDKMGLAYSVNSSYSGYQSGGIFRAYILTGYSQKERARLALLEEVDRLRTRLVSYDELVRAKRYHLGLFQIDLQGNSSISSSLAYDELIGLGYDFMDNYSELIKRVTRQKVKRAAEKFLKPQSYAIALLTPATFPKNLQ